MLAFFCTGACRGGYAAVVSSQLLVVNRCAGFWDTVSCGGDGGERSSLVAGACQSAAIKRSLMLKAAKPLVITLLKLAKRLRNIGTLASARTGRSSDRPYLIYTIFRVTDWSPCFACRK